ncbi:hypothetical protein [Lactobacillus crispatus]|uniref:hypothetical protein n=1 Tax=Lactobacillus crispatus TaxID=47770 RepID=UPI00207078BD|nr:hypothetical protein [Lactobacillus crispatus]WEB33836.1 hypothetical protein PUW44_06295 [Lactobacillus crispatus]DAQ70478.1 MAG TPA: hypothetical protein [Caudoviricetes sp.]
MKPNTRILNYVTLVQDGVLTLDDVPQDITKEVTKWVRYLSGVTDNGMVKEDTATPTVSTTPAPTPSAVVTKPILPKVGD